jgi:hypothetical protein
MSEAHTESATLEQAERFGAQLRSVLEMMARVDELADCSWLRKYLRRSGIGLQWSIAYEFSSLEQFVLLMHLIGMADDLRAAGDAQDKYEATLSLMEKDVPCRGVRPKPRVFVLVIGMLMAMKRSMQCVGLHSKTMDELVAEGLAGDDFSLRRAVAVDPTVLAMPRVNAYVSTLLRRKKQRVLANIYRSALNGPNKQLLPNVELRYLERVLREGGVLKSVSRESVFELVVQRLKLYDARGSDPFKGLFTLFGRWEADATT